MAGVYIKVAGGNQDVFWVGGFHDQQATRLEHPQGLLDQGLELLKSDVLDHVKGRDKHLAFVWQANEVGDGIALLCSKAKFTAGCEHAVVEVDAYGSQSHFSEQFEPLTTTTAQVNGLPLGVSLKQRQNERQVGLQALFDEFTRAPMLVFECAVKMVAHGVHLTSGGNQATPTKSGWLMLTTLKTMAWSHHS